MFAWMVLELKRIRDRGGVRIFLCEFLVWVIFWEHGPVSFLRLQGRRSCVTWVRRWTLRQTHRMGERWELLELRGGRRLVTDLGGANMAIYVYRWGIGCSHRMRSPTHLFRKRRRKLLWRATRFVGASCCHFVRIRCKQRNSYSKSSDSCQSSRSLCHPSRILGIRRRTIAWRSPWLDPHFLGWWCHAELRNLLPRDEPSIVLDRWRRMSQSGGMGSCTLWHGVQASLL